MDQVTSKDGTTIAYSRRGDGPPVVILTGALDDGSENDALATELANNFTVYNVVRRGRGESGDTLPYSVAREVEDVAAVIEAAGEPAHLIGVSSGGGLAFAAADAGLPIGRIAVYEVPYQVGDDFVHVWTDYVDNLTAALADGDNDRALELFMQLAGSSADQIAGAKESDFWPALLPIAPTLAYDAACMGDGPPPEDLLRTIMQPTLVATGNTLDPNMADLQPGFFDAAADAVAAALPSAERQVVVGSSHVVDPKVFAPILVEFFRR